MAKPKLQLIAEYSKVYGKLPPKDLTELLPKGTTKTEMAGMAIYANNRLLPKLSKYLDYSFETQNQLLDYYLQIEPSSQRKNLFKNILANEVLIFNRPANLYAITLILNSDLPFSVSDSKRDTLDYRCFLKFYLACNEIIVSYKKVNEEETSNIEELSANFIATEVYNQHLNPLFVMFRGYKLFKYLSESEQYGVLLNEYTNDIGYTPTAYFKEISSMYFSKHAEKNKDEFRFFFPTEEKNNLLEHLSMRELPIEEDNLLEAKHIRKSPFLKLDEKTFLLLDSHILIEKLCEGMIWDFLFEKVLINVPDDKRKNVIKRFKGEIGLFYEGYLQQLINYSFPYYQYPAPKLFDNLKFNGQELADIFIREKKKVLIGQVKSSSIPASSKFSKSSTFLLNENRSRFFKTHGMDQLINSITNLIPMSDDLSLGMHADRPYTVFPILVTNERAIVTATFPEVFRQEFESRLEKIKVGNLNIKRLNVLHISDWENLSLLFREKKIRLFRLLEAHEKNNNHVFPLFLSYIQHKTHSPDFIKEALADFMN